MQGDVGEWMASLASDVSVFTKFKFQEIDQQVGGIISDFV